MRVNLEWLREWVNVDFNGDALADMLTTAGLEVDEVVSVASGMAGVLVARVESVEKHPAADRLSVCRVNDGSELHDVLVNQALPGSGVDPEVFFAGLADLVAAYGPRNAELLEVRVGGDAAEAVWVDPEDLAPYELWDQTLRLIHLGLAKRSLV